MTDDRRGEEALDEIRHDAGEPTSGEREFLESEEPEEAAELEDDDQQPPPAFGLTR